VKRLMSYAAISSAAVSLAIVAGCQNSQQPPAAALTPTASVMQLSPASAAPQAAPTPTPVSADSSTPMETSTPTPMADIVANSSPLASGTGSSYTVKRGDTLYHIALTHYGNGNQWQRIVQANPGISPTHLRVGQTLILP
jgi:5'-nucleotidase / UDP-sugar diphosphatase